jgi:hypothetical protein
MIGGSTVTPQSLNPNIISHDQYDVGWLFPSGTGPGAHRQNGCQKDQMPEAKYPEFSKNPMKICPWHITDLIMKWITFHQRETAI